MGTEMNLTKTPDYSPRCSVNLRTEGIIIYKHNASYRLIVSGDGALQVY